MNVLWSVSSLKLANLTAATNITLLVPAVPMLDWGVVNIGTGAGSRTSIYMQRLSNLSTSPVVCRLASHQIMFKGKNGTKQNFGYLLFSLCMLLIGL